MSLNLAVAGLLAFLVPAVVAVVVGKILKFRNRRRGGR
jgi:hypothetical protein